MLKKELVDLFYGAILHDIGYVVQRARDQRGNLPEAGADWLAAYTNNPVVLDHVRYHKTPHLPKLTCSPLTYITHVADKMASEFAGQGVVEAESDQSGDGLGHQEDIFNAFDSKESKRFHHPEILTFDGQPNFATKEKINLSASDNAVILKSIEESLQKMTLTEDYMASLLNTLEATLSFVPAPIRTKGPADASLFEQSKLTAALAFSIYHFLMSQDRKHFEKELLKEVKPFYQENAFLLFRFELSGIQGFIYNIATKGAAKQLKARSFYLDFMSEHIADCVLDTLNLTRANLIYLGGGHAYMLLPNTEETKGLIARFEEEFNHFLLEHYQTRLHLSVAWSAFSANDIMKKGNLPKIYHDLNQQISDKNVSRYNGDILMRLNKGGKNSGRECVICHAVDKLSEDGEQVLCSLCSKLQAFSKQIETSYFIISDQEDGLPIGPKAYLGTLSENAQKATSKGKIYQKNNYQTGETIANHVFIGDYKDSEIYDYATLSTQVTNGRGDKSGIKRLAVLRLDVDDLGAAFMAGFTVQEAGAYNTFSRLATFSRSMSRFFKVYINQFAKGKCLSIIYSGGDDVFAIGTWQDIIAFTIELRKNFLRWTNGKLTLSAGIGLFPDKTPVSIMAKDTEALEEAAKEKGKDSLALFDLDYVFKFDVFIKNIYGADGKLERIRQFFDRQEKQSAAFLYRLLELLRSSDRMDIARLAYYLSQIEDLTEVAEKENFKIFKKEFFIWANQDSQTKKEAEVALTLYLYEIRKED